MKMQEQVRVFFGSFFKQGKKKTKKREATKAHT